MGKVSETDAIKAVDDALSGLDETDARQRVLTWAWEKFSSKPMPPIGDGSGQGTDTTKPMRPKAKTPTGPKGKGKGRAKASLSIVKDLNLKPKSKESFDAFVKAKEPKSIYEKCAVSVYYLGNLGLKDVSSSHVYTCFKYMNWRLPTNLRNALAYTAWKHGWVDTSNMQDIKITTIGENLIEHDLPKKKGPEKS